MMTYTGRRHLPLSTTSCSNSICTFPIQFINVSRAYMLISCSCTLHQKKVKDSTTECKVLSNSKVSNCKRPVIYSLVLTCPSKHDRAASIRSCQETQALCLWCLSCQTLNAAPIPGGLRCFAEAAESSNHLDVNNNDCISLWPMI